MGRKWRLGNMRDQTIHVSIVLPRSRDAVLYRRYRICQRVLVFVLVSLTGFCLDAIWRDVTLTLGLFGLLGISEHRDWVLWRVLSSERVTEFVADEVKSDRLPRPGAADANPPASRLYN